MSIYVVVSIAAGEAAAMVAFMQRLAHGWGDITWLKSAKPVLRTPAVMRNCQYLNDVGFFAINE
jgi:hypothetical protein